MGKFKFGVRSSAAVEGGYSEAAITPTPVGGDRFEVALPNPGTVTRFYQVSLSLK